MAKVLPIDYLSVAESNTGGLFDKRGPKREQQLRSDVNLDKKAQVGMSHAHFLYRQGQPSQIVIHLLQHALLSIAARHCVGRAE
jgi:hypothetical protein